MGLVKVPRTFTHESGYISIDMESAIGNAELVYNENKYAPEKPWRWRIEIDMGDWISVDQNITLDIDLFDLLDWLKEHKPDLLEERGLIVPEKQEAE